MAIKFELVGKANRDLIVAGVERLRVAYEKFIHEQQAAGVDFKYIDGQMIAHNFFKLVVAHIAEESGTDKKVLLRMALDTLSHAVAKPITNETDVDLN